MNTTKTTDTDKTDATAGADEVTEVPGGTEPAEPTGTEPTDPTDADLDDEPEYIEVPASTGIGAGAGAVVGAALGLASITGTWAGRLAAERQQLIGQIKTSSGGAQAQDQIAALYGTPWHTTAVFNGFFAVIALIVAGAVLLLPTVKPAAVPQAPWIRAVAWSGVALGALGLLISGALYFDLFGMPTAG
ncbi:hypothetical protein ABZW18_03550 [Streptomyces sp. NPDC004647]|uniref:hypothetical protein n=1 Tax=Streptomyces sp. NPDC004647 TaxID=3154671 RepID=UPI0033B4E8F0